MAPNYSPLRINRALEANLRAVQTAEVRDEDARKALGALLQSALQLEFATIPTYLSAAFSLTSNARISELIMRAAIEEMLHMTAVANLMNAIGIAPDIVAAVPKYPYELAVLDPPLKLDLCSFSFDLVEKLFMSIEAPEFRVIFEARAIAPRPRTIGQFYAGIIEIIEGDTIPDLFKDAVRDAYKQRVVKPNFKSIAYLNNQDTHKYPLDTTIDFMITDKASAVRHLSWVVDQGEGEAPYNPLATEGIPGHHYRFESIIRKRYLIKDENAAKGYSFSGGDLPFVATGVHEFDPNAKAENYQDHPLVAGEMKRFNQKYTKMINFLQQAFNCPSPQQQQDAAAAYQQALGIMRGMRNSAGDIIREARASGIKGGIPFEYAGPAIS